MQHWSDVAAVAVVKAQQQLPTAVGASLWQWIGPRTQFDGGQAGMPASEPLAGSQGWNYLHKQIIPENDINITILQ